MLPCRLFLCVIFLSSVTRSEVFIDSDGGYKNLIIGISPDIQATNIESLLQEFETILTNASQKLYRATRKLTYFKEVIFVLPKQFQTSLTKTKWTSWNAKFKNPDIFMTANDIYSNMYTIQHAGCGKSGLRIHVPEQFINKSSINKEIYFVREWAHYRYGVFDESGYAGDPVYPACYNIPGSDDMKITDCTNGQAVYEFRKNSKDGYENQHVCTPVPVEGQNMDIESSLMTKMDFPKVDQFCDGKTYSHNRDAPSKQNSLCRERSTWEVISQHDDFNFKRKIPPKSTAPNFKYVIDAEVRIIVAVDSSSNMVKNDRLDIVRNAFSYFVLNDLPEGSTIGVMNLKNNSKSVTMVTLHTQDDAERIIDTFPEAYGDESICVECGIKKAIQILRSTSKQELLVITATDLDQQLYNTLADNLKTNGLLLHTIFFKKKISEMPYLHKLSKLTGGKFFYIPEGFNQEYLLSPLVSLYEAFRMIYQSFSWMNKNHILVDHMTFTNLSSKNYSLSFEVDRSMEYFQVLITGPGFLNGPTVMKDSVMLLSDDNTYLPGHSSFAYKMKIPAFIFSFDSLEIGKWTLSFQRRVSYNKPIVALIRAKNKKLTDVIGIKPWIASENNFKKGIKRPDLTLYAEVKSSHHPVMNMSVKAYLYHPVSNEQFSFSLYDSGEGDPDITGNDGIFSRYITGLQKTGYYLITMIAEADTQDASSSKNAPVNEHCCGSSLPMDLLDHTDSFKRIVTLESIFIESESIRKTFPPRKITDLRVERVDIMESNVKYYILKWTAPGDDYDSGTAADYQMRIFSSRDDALTNFDTQPVLKITEWNIHGSWLVPHAAGTIQTAVVELKNLSSGIYFMALRTIGQSDLKGGVSNIVQIKYDEPIFPVNTDESIIPSEFTTLITDEKTDKSALLSSDFGLAIGITCGVLFLLMIIGFILCIYLSHYKRKKNKPGFSQGAQKTESNDTLCRSPENGNISIISPVHSWGANSLLSHYETVQRRNTLTNDIKPAIPTEEPSDTTSVASSKYLSINRIDQQNSSFYDTVYFQDIQDRDDLNFPFNPAFSPFSPVYTSSLRKSHDNSGIIYDYPLDCASIYSTSLEERRVPRLRTDV